MDQSRTNDTSVYCYYDQKKKTLSGFGDIGVVRADGVLLKVRMNHTMS
jgi:uncharacterized protein YlbG (UPF0298 family)